MSKKLNRFEKIAEELDTKDELKVFRERFSLPKDKLYLCNNSLGLPAKAASNLIHEQLHQWEEMGVEGWFKGKAQWYGSFDKLLKNPLARLLGAERDEVVVMNTLTINLHLLLVSFYRPKKTRYKILIEAPCFPSDLYAIKSHLRYHGYDPIEDLIVIKPRIGEHLLRQEDIEKAIVEQGNSIALVFLSSVNFLTGQVLDMQALTKLAKEQGCVVGYDIAHAAGNVPLQLHQWGVDFAVGCSYKYLCSGPGGPGLAFVHAEHHEQELPRFSGWWGNDPKTRFHMHLQEEFIPFGGAASWQLSTPSILAMLPLVASLAIYDEAGIENLRKKSEQQTAFLLEMLDCISGDTFEIITPREAQFRGCQLSLLFNEKSEERLLQLEKKGVVCDFRPPNVIRVTPSPLYNTFNELYQFTCRLAR